MPKQLTDCVADLKSQGKPKDQAWPMCIDSTGEKPHKEVKEDHNPLDIPFGYEVKEQLVQEKINANRQVPVFNPPITNRSVKPQKDKSKKGIGGQVGKIDSDAKTNNMSTDMWKKILDAQLRRNVKEPRY